LTGRPRGCPSTSFIRGSTASARRVPEVDPAKLPLDLRAIHCLDLASWSGDDTDARFESLVTAIRGVRDRAAAVHDDVRPAGEVRAPAAGTKLAPGEPVTLYVSTAGQTKVPGVVALRDNAARTTLEG
jgi:hypothetical protein